MVDPGDRGALGSFRPVAANLPPCVANGARVRSLAEEDHAQRAEDNLQIDPERPIPDIPNVKGGFVGGREVSTTLDLRPSREAGSDGQASGKSWKLILRQQRSWTNK